MSLAYSITKKWNCFKQNNFNNGFTASKGILEGIVPKDSPLLYASHVEGSGVDLYQQICKLSAYGSDELPWIKVLNPNYSQREGRRELFEKRRGAAR